MAQLNYIDHFIDRLFKRRTKLFQCIEQPLLTANVSQQTQRQIYIKFIQLLADQKQLTERNIRSLLKSYNHMLIHYLPETLNNLSILIQCYPSQSSHFLSPKYAHMVAYILYRVCIGCANSYQRIYDWVNQMMDTTYTEYYQQFNRMYFLTQMYLIGFPIANGQFQERIFPDGKYAQYQYRYIYLDYLAYLSPILNCPSFLLPKLRHKLHFKTQKTMEKLMGEYRQLTKEIKQAELEVQSAYCSPNQPNLYNLQNAYQALLSNWKCLKEKLNVFRDVEVADKDKLTIQGEHIKQLQKIKDQCALFRKQLNWHNQVTSYQKQLYYQDISNHQVLVVTDFITLQQDQAFLGQLPFCSSISRSKQLSIYFLEKLKSVSNMEKIVQLLLRQYSGYPNIVYIMRVFYLISLWDPTIISILNQSVSQLKNALMMVIEQGDKSKQYSIINTIIELVKFQLVDPHQLIFVMLKQLSLSQLNSNIINSCIEMLQCLGTVGYYRDLLTHLGMNRVITMIEGMLDTNSKMGDQLNHKLSSLVSFLRKQRGAINSDSAGHTLMTSNPLMMMNIQNDFNGVLEACMKLLREGKSDTIIEYISYCIERSGFITNYYYASLVREIGNTQLDKICQQVTMNNIVNGLLGDNTQGAVCWSRFYGQLYNYEVVRRKSLLLGLEEILLVKVKLDSIIKCINSALDTSKCYLIEGRSKSAQNTLLLFLIKLKKLVIQNGLQNNIIQHEFSDILQYFNPLIISKLKTVPEIQHFLKQVQSKTRDTYDIAYILRKLNYQPKQYLELKKEDYLDYEEQKYYVDKQTWVRKNEGKVIEKQVRVNMKKTMKVITRKKHLNQQT